MSTLSAKFNADRLRTSYIREDFIHSSSRSGLSVLVVLSLHSLNPDPKPPAKVFTAWNSCHSPRIYFLSHNNIIIIKRFWAMQPEKWKWKFFDRHFLIAKGRVKKNSRQNILYDMFNFRLWRPYVIYISPCRNIKGFGHLRFIKSFWHCHFIMEVYENNFFYH